MAAATASDPRVFSAPRINPYKSDSSAGSSGYFLLLLSFIDALADYAGAGKFPPPLRATGEEHNKITKDLDAVMAVMTVTAWMRPR